MAAAYTQGGQLQYVVTDTGAPETTPDGYRYLCSITVYGPDQMDATCTSASCCGTHDCQGAPIYPACRHDSHALVDPSQCGAARNYSAFGLSRQALRGVPSLYEGSVAGAAPACLSCEALPITNEAEVIAKYTCLKQNLDSIASLPVDRPRFETLLVSRLKLLYELKGNLLGQDTQGDARRSFIRSLYRTRPSLRHDCGPQIGFNPPDVDASCDVTDLNGTLDMCSRVTADNVPGQVAMYTYTECRDLITPISSLSDTLCQGAIYREAYARISTELLKKSFYNLQPDASFQFTQTDLRTALTRVNDWYTRIRQFVYPGANPDERLWSYSSQALGGFWSAVNVRGFVRADGITETTEDTFNQGITLDRSVLTAALTATPPLQGAPMVMLLGDAFKALAERLSDMTIFHDLGCRFLSCAAGQMNSELSDLLRLFAALADASGLDSELRSIIALPASTYDGHRAWNDVFAALRTQHLVLQAAVRDATGASSYSADLLTKPLATELRPPMQVLAKIVQDAQTKSTAYRNYGRFDSVGKNILHTGMQEAQWTELDRLVDARSQELQTVIADYRRQKIELIRSLLQELQRRREANNIRNQIEIKIQRQAQLMEDRGGLAAYAEVEDARYSDFLTTFNSVLDHEEDRGILINRAQYRLPLSAGDARFAGTRSDDVTSDAVWQDGRPWMLRVGRGDVLNIETTGSWAPKCALSRSDVVRPFGGSGIDVSGVRTGPEGWVLQEQSGSFRARQHQSVHTETEYTTVSARASACAGVRVEAHAGFDLGFFGASVTAYASAEACMSLDHGQTWSTSTSDSTSQGRETRSTASFTSGIRLANTPYPNLPAGALLLVEVPRANPDRRQVIDIHVLMSPQSSVILSQDADVYLVVNDLDGRVVCGGIDSQALSVNIHHLQPAGAVSRSLGQAMADVYTQLRADTELSAAQGRILPQDLTAKRDWSYSKLRERCGDCDLAQYPQELISLFGTFVSKELARLERKVEMKVVDRQLLLGAMELKAIRDDLAASQDEARLIQTITALSLKNLSDDYLRYKTRALAEIVNDYLFPVMDIRFPQSIANLLSDTTARRALEDLVKANWSADIDNTGVLARTAVDYIKDKFQRGRISLPPASYPMIALSFPKPGADTRSSTWHKVDPSRSQFVWDHLRQNDIFSMQVRPEDLYATGGSFILLCSEEAPVIRSMGLFALRNTRSDHAFWNGGNWRMRIDANPDLAFPTRSGIKSYMLDNSDWTSSGIRIISGDYSTEFGAETLFTGLAARLQTFNGLSPFTTFDIDATALRRDAEDRGLGNPLKDATELVLLMEIERRGGRVVVAPICQ